MKGSEVRVLLGSRHNSFEHPEAGLELNDLQIAEEMRGVESRERNWSLLQKREELVAPSKDIYYGCPHPW